MHEFPLKYNNLPVKFDGNSTILLIGWTMSIKWRKISNNLTNNFTKKLTTVA